MANPKGNPRYDLPRFEGEQARENGRKGGLVRSPKKRLASKIRALQRFKGDDAAAMHLLEVLTDPDYSAADIYQNILKLTPEDFKDQALYTRLLMDFHKMAHGVKKDPDVQVNIQNNTQINISDDINEVYKQVLERGKKKS